MARNCCNFETEWLSNSTNSGRDWRIGSRSFEYNPRRSPDVSEVRVTSSVCVPVRSDSIPNESPGPSFPTFSFLRSSTSRVASMTPEKINWTASSVAPWIKSCSPAPKVRLMIFVFRSSFSDELSGSSSGMWLNSSDGIPANLVLSTTYRTPIGTMAAPACRVAQSIATVRLPLPRWKRY
jgi:hypothetical protein